MRECTLRRVAWEIAVVQARDSSFHFAERPLTTRQHSLYSLRDTLNTSKLLFIKPSYPPHGFCKTHNTYTMADPASLILASVDEHEELPKTKEKVDELTQAASLHYSTKNFSAAADNYADAVEIQAELNGEMAPENAELLFYYGRALYKVAVAKSDVLGNKVAQEDKKKSKSKKAAKADAGEGANGAKAKSKEESVDSKPYFQLTGDENWTDSEEEDEDDDEEGEQEEEEDDFGNAYETFELARVLYSKQLEALEGADSGDKGKGKAELSPQARTIKEKIADCHGFLVDISLENERFHDAISDARAALALQEELKPFEHENVTEGHYSLSLALEFASVSKIREEQTGRASDAPTEGEAQEGQDSIDWDLRNEAAKQTELAIQSLEARLKKEQAALSSDTLTPEQKKEKQTVIEDKKGMLEELTTRVTDLKLDPTKQEVDSIDPTVFQGLLGGLLGADAATQKAKIAEATKSANDVTGLVKTKKKAKPTPAAASNTQAGSSTKRKLEVDGNDATGKRSKTEEPS
jgi:HAT1-interacting factor 1